MIHKFCRNVWLAVQVFHSTASQVSITLVTVLSIQNLYVKMLDEMIHFTKCNYSVLYYSHDQVYF